jgi:aspartate racemase
MRKWRIIGNMGDRDKIVGVLGGMGPDATVDFMATVIALTPAETDQDHVHMIVDIDPSIPERQDAILRDGADPGPAMARMAQGLQNAGAEFLVIPCNTAYAFASQVKAAISIPLLSIIDVTVSACDEFDKVGLLATEGCLRSEVYQQAFQKVNIELLLPTDEELQEFMNLTFRIKSGDKSADVAAGMLRLANALPERGAQAIIAGCTEIPLVLNESMMEIPLISSTNELAKQTVACARGDVPLAKKE